MTSVRRELFWIFPCFLILLGAGGPAFAEGDVSAGLGVGGYVSPVPANATDNASRTNFVIDAAANWSLIPELCVGLLEVGSFGGGDFTLAPTDNVSESIINSATAVVLTRVWESEKFQGNVGVSLGAGPFYVSDQIHHSGATLSSSGWGPMSIAQCIWSSPLGAFGFYRFRVAWIWASTDLPVADNPGYRQKSDWNRLELTVGLGLKL
jgi:hypothetical protein